MVKKEFKKELNQIRTLLNLAWQNIYYLLFFIIIFEIIAYYSFTNYSKRTVSHDYRVNYLFFEPTEFLQQQNKLLKIMEEDITILFSTAIFDKTMFTNKELSNPSFTIIKNFTELKGVLPSSEINRKISMEHIINEIIKDFTFDVDYFTNAGLVSKKIENLGTRLLFNFSDKVNAEEDYEILINDYLLIQSKNVFQINVSSIWV